MLELKNGEEKSVLEQLVSERNSLLKKLDEKTFALDSLSINSTELFFTIKLLNEQIENLKLENHKFRTILQMALNKNAISFEKINGVNLSPIERKGTTDNVIQLPTQTLEKKNY